MRKNKRLVIKRGDLEFFEILLLIVISVVPYISVTVKLALQLLLVMLNFGKIRSLSKCFYIALVLMVVPSLIDLFNVTKGNPYNGNNLAFPLAFLVGALVASKYEIDDFMEKTERLLFALGILSLLGMSVYFVAPSLISRFPTYTFYGLSHRTIYFFNYIYAQGFLMVRNSGIAWEPGVFQILMNLGLAISVARKEKLDYKRVIVYSTAIIFTRSTTGLLILMINLLLVIRKKKAFIIILLIALAFFSSDVYSIINYQIGKKWVGSYAFENRYTPTINALKYGIKFPLGIGSTRYNAIYEEMAIGSFDSYTQILMRYGYGLLGFVIYSLIRILKRDWFVGIVMILSMLSESMWNCVFFTTIYFMYLNENSRNTDERIIELERDNGREE